MVWLGRGTLAVILIGACYLPILFVHLAVFGFLHAMGELESQELQKTHHVERAVMLAMYPLAAGTRVRKKSNDRKRGLEAVEILAGT